MGMSGGNDNDTMSEINVTPFVDVMLVLLVIFMVTAPMMTQGMMVQLPKAEANSLPQSEKQLNLSITEDGQFYINKEPLTISEMRTKLNALAQVSSDRDVLINADGRVPYQKVADLMSIATQAGFTKIGMITQPGGTEQ
ncbi:MAG: protein TolR [Deltaproteobacteria bacterium]|nr:protein TolR [Deltaproteobacteria bacterium]